MRKLTNEIIDQKLKKTNKKIKRIGECLGSLKYIDWECLLDGYVWKATPTAIFTKNCGCLKCAGVLPYTNDQIDFLLINKPIQRIDNIINNTTPINWNCLKNHCNYKWAATPNSILKLNSGCPKCSGNLPLNNNIVDERLKGRYIKRLDNYINIKKYIKWQCLIDNCNFIWETSPDNILNDSTGCPECGIGKNAKLIINSFKEKNILYEKEYSIKNFDKNNPHYKFDFYFDELKLAIEYNGEQHYKPVRFGGITLEKAEQNFIKQQKRDQYKRQFCKDNNIELIEIDGRKYKNNILEKYVLEELIPYINKISI